MDNILSEEQIDDLLDNVIGTYNPNMWKNDNKLVCCPVHGESRPSMGISSSKQVCHCFSCGFAGDFSKLLMYSLPDDFGFDNSTLEKEKRTSFRAYRKAEEFIALRYELSLHEIGRHTRKVKRYEQQIDGGIYLEEDIVPHFKLAPFKSGKETYNYFFERGFDKYDLKKFMIGRDIVSKTVTIPVFYENGKLAGIIGRYISNKRAKHERYKIYDHFNRSKLLYPMNIAQVKNGVIILVEGQFDAIYMHKLGYDNTYAMLTNHISKKQAKWIFENCEVVIWMGDNDERGIEGREDTKKRLKNRVNFKIVDYPPHGKDVCDWSKDEIDNMINNAHSGIINIRRIE